ncbi:MAG: NUDIX hydrolase, partial [Endomicrobiaceae bacterium]
MRKSILRELIRKTIPFKKFITLMTTLCFLITSVFSQAVYGFPSANTIPLTLNDINSINNQLIPFNIGKITDALYNGKGRIVINIQDLHSHEQTQRNISTILSILDKKYGLDKVYVEGAVGPVETGWLTKIKNDQIKENVLNNLLTSGRLTGSEYYAAEKGRDNLLEGIENRHTYIQNLKRLKEIYDKKTEIESYLPHINKILQQTAEKYYSKNNLRLNKIISENQNGKLRSDKYFEYLISSSIKAKIDLRKYGSIIEFIKLLEKQKELKREKINEEIGKLLNELKAKLTYAQYKALTDKIGKKAQESEFYYELAKIVQKEGMLSYGEYKNAKIFFEYIILNQDLNPIELAKQEKNLLEELNYRFSETEAEKEIYFLKEYAGYMSGYLNNKLTAEEYEYFIKHISDFKLLWAKYADIDGIIDITKYFELFDAFYKDNVERNKYFIQNIIGQMPKDAESGFRVRANINHKQKILEELAENKQVTVVVTGGFHTYGFNKLLADEGINYIVITPNITEETFTAEKKYENVFKEQETVLYETLQKMLISQIGSGAVLNTDVLKSVFNNNKQAALDILNQMMSNISPDTVVIDIDRQDDSFVVKIKKSDKEESITIQDSNIKEANSNETDFSNDVLASFKAFGSIQAGFMKVREEKRSGQEISVNTDEMKDLTGKVQNSAVKEQLEQSIEKLENLIKIEKIRQELEKLSQYNSTRLTQEKIDETITALEQNKLKLRNENFDIIEKNSDGKEIVIGVVDRNIAHHLELYHRVACMFVVTPEGNIIEIRRAMHKSEPGQITPYGGHVSSGETYESTRRRELIEELGLPKEWNLQGSFKYLTTEDKYTKNSFDQKHDTLLDNDSMHLSVYFASADELSIIREESKKLKDLRQEMTLQEYNKYLENNEIENFDIREFSLDDFISMVSGGKKQKEIYTFADGSIFEIENSFPDFFKRILFSKENDVKKFREIVNNKLFDETALSFNILFRISKFLANIFTRNGFSANLAASKIAAVIEAPLMMFLPAEKFVLMHYGRKNAVSRIAVEEAVAKKDFEYLSEIGYTKRLKGTNIIIQQTKQSFTESFKKLFFISAGLASVSILFGFINPALFLGLIPSVVIGIGFPLFAKALPVNIGQHLAYNRDQSLQEKPALLSLKDKYKVTIDGQEYFTEAVSETSALNNAIFKAAKGNRLEMYLLRENANIKVELLEQETYYSKKTNKYKKRDLRMKSGEYLFTVIIPGINDNSELKDYQTVYAHSPRQAVFAVILKIFYDVKNGFLTPGKYSTIVIDGKNESNVSEITTKILDSYKGIDLGKLIKYHKLIMRPSRTNKPVYLPVKKQKQGTNLYKVVIPGLNDGNEFFDYQKVSAFDEESAVREAVLNLISAKRRGEIEGGWYNNTAINRENLTDIVSYILADKNFIVEKQKETYKQLGFFETEGFDSLASKMEIEGIWNKIQNKWWVKLIGKANKKANSQYRKYLSRNLAVSIAEMPRTINIEKFINDHINPEEVRDAAIELNTVTARQFSQTASIAWKFSLAGILGIFLTAATGGLALAAFISVTAISAVAPFIAAVKKNIEWHYTYNNMQDSKAITEINAILSDLRYNSKQSKESYNELKNIINETEGIKLSDDYLPSYVLMINKNYEISRKIQSSNDILLKDAWNKINIIVASRYISRLNMNWGYKYKKDEDRQAVEKIVGILNEFKEKINSYIEKNKDSGQAEYTAENLRYSITRLIDDGSIFENLKFFEETAKQWPSENNDYNEIIKTMYENIAQVIKLRNSESSSGITVTDGIEKLLGKEYPELVSQTKADVKRMIEEDA